MAENIAGTPEENNGYEIIVYCGVGGYASSWWYLLTQVLGYENVKFYDGSAQEWVREYDMKPFEWQD
jgi:thiosulfate/3-mercaptopyruvate sulfurtransferase